VASAWDLADTALASSNRLYLWGPPGVGKSYLAVKSGQAPVQVTFSEDLTVQELIGHYMPEGGVFRWHYGPISQAMRDGALLILNEIARASGAVQDFLLGVLDNAEVASIALPTGEKLRPARGFCVVATSNTSPESLDPALRSRFEVEIHLTEPNPAIITNLNQSLRGLGEALKDSFKDPSRALDPRKLRAFMSLIRSGVLARPAALMTFGDQAPDLMAVLTARGIRFA
jgi:MoxR-like ATPase